MRATRSDRAAQLKTTCQWDPKGKGEYLSDEAKYSRAKWISQFYFNIKMLVSVCGYNVLSG